MNNNKKNTQKIYKRRIVALSILAIALLALIVSLLNKNRLRKIAQDGNMLVLGNQDVIITDITSNEPNVPVVGAGMIPIKWNSSINMWQITTKSDKEWYNYANGNYANVMLSDGYYKSELQVGTTKDQLAENNVGVGVPDDPGKLGTIYTWIPRFAYLEDDIKFLKNNSILEYEWTTESCFNLEGYGANSLDLAFTGIWVGEKEYETSEELEARNSEMLLEDNIEGLISNEKIFNITESEKTAIQKLTGKYANTNTKILQDIDGMKYRQVIKIVNTNSRIPIVGKHIIVKDGIKVDTKYAENKISFIADKNGNKLDRNTLPINEDETQYTFYIVDSIGNIRKYRMGYGSGAPNIKSFNKNITFYVTYNDETGEENSIIPIGEQAPENWYNYEEQKWANIVVRNKGQENYYVWVPRYMYKIGNAEEQRIDAKLVDLENVWTDPKTGKTQDLDRTDYKLPEAFTWEDPEDPNNKVQLTGFWANKYKLRENIAYIPEISGGSGVIRVNNIIENIGSEYTYEMYLIRDGKRIVYDEAAQEYVEYKEDSTPISLTGNYTFTNLPVGNYAVNIIVKDSDGSFVEAITNEVIVLERVEPNVPDTSSFNQNLTYYVIYDENGNEDSSIPVGTELTPEQKSKWYNYDTQNWANIVVRENGLENYFVWVPRYEYALDEEHQSSKVQFISVEKTKPDEGYKIPEAFIVKDEIKTGEDQVEIKTTELSGFWASKYKLRDDAVYGLDASVTAGETSIKISNINAKVDGVEYCDVSLIQDGKVLKTEKIEKTKPTEDGEEGSFVGVEHSFTGLEPGTYAINLMAKTTNGDEDLEEGIMIAGYSTEVTLTKIEVDLSGFNKATTYYVTYDENGIEHSEIPIGENAPDGWYDYAEQKWANIVVRNKGQENYYVWVPRYQYVLNSKEEKVKAELIPVTKETPDPGYKIPEAFSWEDPNNPENKVQISGFWANKYKLRENLATPEISGGSGVIYVKNINDYLNKLKIDYTQYTFEAYLINSEGKRIVKSGNSYVEGTTPVQIEDNYTFTNVEEGNYSVNIVLKNKETNEYYTSISNYVTVTKKAVANPPDLTGFNKNVTFYVIYNDVTGNETSNIPIGEYTPTTQDGAVGPSNWYDYDTQHWANIVVRENGLENYFVWVPRYEYALDEEHQTSKVIFIPESQTEADEGYEIPEAFTVTDENGTTELSGFWASKYKLRDDAVYTVDATVAAGANRIRVSNIIPLGEGLNFTATLIHDGKRVGQGKSIISSSGEAVFDGLTPGEKYSVLVEQWNGVEGTVSSVVKEVLVPNIDEPDLTGFNVNMTYIVTYDSEGNETTTLLNDVLDSGAVIENNALVSGKVNVNRISGVWYDYAEQKWANIVVIKDDNIENYFVWVPRYQYAVNGTRQKVKAELIPVTKETPDPGYKIPEAFSWQDPNYPDDPNKKVQISGFWANKYKLRE